MDEILKQILIKLNGLESKVDELYELKDKINELYERKDKIDESHEWLSAMHHSNQVYKAEIDQIQHKIKCYRRCINRRGQKPRTNKKSSIVNTSVAYTLINQQAGRLIENLSISAKTD